MLRSACAYAQSDQSLCKSLKYSMTVKLLTEQHLEFLSLKVGCTGSYESTLVKMPHCYSFTYLHTLKTRYNKRMPKNQGFSLQDPYVHKEGSAKSGLMSSQLGVLLSLNE